jgi:hypothetical protein
LRLPQLPRSASPAPRHCRACSTSAVMRNGARRRVPAMGASAISTSRRPSVRKVQSADSTAMSGDRLKMPRSRPPPDRRSPGSPSSPARYA